MIIPFVPLSIPICLYGFAFITQNKAIYDSFGVLLLSTIAIGGYPLLNNLCCIIMMKPYRKYAREFLSKIFPCIPVNSTAKEISSHAASSAA